MAGKRTFGDPTAKLPTRHLSVTTYKNTSLKLTRRKCRCAPHFLTFILKEAQDSLEQIRLTREIPVQCQLDPIINPPITYTVLPISPMHNSARYTSVSEAFDD